MNKPKMFFMQGAPSFVFVGAGVFGVFFIGCNVVAIVKGDNWGYFYICLALAGFLTVLAAFRQAKRLTGKSVFTLMQENEDYWKTHDK